VKVAQGIPDDHDVVNIWEWAAVFAEGGAGNWMIACRWCQSSATVCDIPTGLKSLEGRPFGLTVCRAAITVRAFEI
jgi:hypothetical protein